MREDTDMSVIRLLVLDIDGVLTDGSVWFDANGNEYKSLYYRDLDTITALQKQGMVVVLVTGEDGPLTEQFWRRTGTARIYTGAKDKLSALNQVCSDYNLSLKEVCYVGDSDRDAPALKAVTLGLTPADASESARLAADHILGCEGGRGVIVEASQLILAYV
jgi:3-deoxy-D-manno-octulosonate 8-phosphate phosphatase (KDO 8-P phosphatase)